MSAVLDLHMAGKHIGHAANLAATHGVGLAGHGKRPHARPADAAGGKVAIDDGVDLVCAARGLVDALAEDSHDALGPGKQRKEFTDGRYWQTCRHGKIGAALESRFKSLFQPGNMFVNVIIVEFAVLRKIRQKAEEQRNVTVWLDRQMQVGNVRRHGPARVDQHDFHFWAQLFGCGDALIEHRMAPGEIGAGQNDEIGEFQIFVDARHGVRAKRTAVARDRRGHAKTGIGVDIGRADKALHQFVGDVIVFS